MDKPEPKEIAIKETISVDGKTFFAGKAMAMPADIELIQSVQGKEEGSAVSDLSKMTKAELLELAKKQGVLADEKMTNKQLIELLSVTQESVN